MPRNRISFVILWLLAFVTGSASCSFGRQLRVETTPVIADVFLGSEYLGQTPITIGLGSALGKELQLQAEGFAPVRYAISEQTKGGEIRIRMYPAGMQEDYGETVTGRISPDWQMRSGLIDHQLASINLVNEEDSLLIGEPPWIEEEHIEVEQTGAWIKYAPDGNTIAYVTWDAEYPGACRWGPVSLWVSSLDELSKRVDVFYELWGERVPCVVGFGFSPDSKWLWVNHSDPFSDTDTPPKFMFVHLGESLESQLDMRDEKDLIGPAWSQDSKRFAATGENLNIFVFKLENNRWTYSPLGIKGKSVGWSPDGQLLFIMNSKAGSISTLQLIDVESNEILWKYELGMFNAFTAGLTWNEQGDRFSLLVPGNQQEEYARVDRIKLLVGNVSTQEMQEIDVIDVINYGVVLYWVDEHRIATLTIDGVKPTYNRRVQMRIFDVPES